MYEYTLLGERTVDAPISSVFESLSNFNRYPIWGASACIEGRGEAPRVGAKGTLIYRGTLPCRVRLDCTMTELEYPHRIAFDVTGDLIGRQLLTLSAPSRLQTTIRSEWGVETNGTSGASLATLLRPLVLWNHQRYTEVAYSGLVSYLEGARVVELGG